MVGRGGCADVGNVLHHNGAGGDTLWVGVMDHVPAYWEGAGWISTSGDEAVDGENDTSGQGRDVDLPSPGEGNDIGGTARD